MRFETGKKETTIFLAGKYAYHMVIFLTHSRLNMVIGVMLIKKHVDRENKMQCIKNSTLGELMTSVLLKIMLY